MPVLQRRSVLLQCLRVDEDGRVTRAHMKRRDMMRYYGLIQRDLRRIEPSIQMPRSSPSLFVKDDVMLVHLAGVRIIITSEHALLLEPQSDTAKQFLAEIIPRRQTAAGRKYVDHHTVRPSDSDSDSQGKHDDTSNRELPFELEVLDSALSVAAAGLYAELQVADAHVQACLDKLPRDITPQNLDELRRAKSALVELESKSDAFREMLEDIVDDDDELGDFNLSSRVLREVQRQQREREQLLAEAHLERQEREKDSSSSSSSSSNGTGRGGNGSGSNNNGSVLDSTVELDNAPHSNGSDASPQRPGASAHLRSDSEASSELSTLSASGRAQAQTGRAQRQRGGGRHGASAQRLSITSSTSSSIDEEWTRMKRRKWGWQKKERNKRSAPPLSSGGKADSNAAGVPESGDAQPNVADTSFRDAVSGLPADNPSQDAAFMNGCAALARRQATLP